MAFRNFTVTANGGNNYTLLFESDFETVFSQTATNTFTDYGPTISYGFPTDQATRIGPTGGGFV